MLEGLFGEYHSSSAALGRQCPGVTKQRPFSDWPASSVRADVKLSFVPIQRKVNGNVKTVIVNALPDNIPHAVCPSTTLITYP